MSLSLRCLYIITNGSPLMKTSTFFTVAMLVDPDTKELVPPIYFKDRVLMPLVGDRVVSVQSVCKASEMELEVPECKAMFVFSDLSVRQEGIYCLQILLFEIVQGEVIYRASVYTLLFKTFTPKGFPGMQSSTDMTVELKRNGIKIRSEKSIHISKKFKRQLDVTNFTQSIMLTICTERTATPTTSYSGGSYCYNIHEHF